jgi:gamma-glutamyltranspeptidase/glutathione hydrolase
MLVLSFVVLAVVVGNLPAAETVRCQNGAVVCVSGPAADIGRDTLQSGGNAVDAAVATAFALAVTYPPAGNIGGGGYMLVVPEDDDGSAVFDFREVAPAAATREMFVNQSGRTPHRRVGVPGTVRGLALAHKRFGKLPWPALVEPATALAREGFEVDAALAKDLNKTLADTPRERFAEFHRAFGKPDGSPWKAGERLVQRELAAVLERIAKRGPEGFYQGETAELIAAEMQRGGGLITTQDLAAYQPVERAPLRGTYRGYEIVAAPPSSSGGTALIEALNILENFDLKSQGRWSPETLHLMIESMKRAFRDRAAYLGDPAVNEIPPRLVEKAYAKKLAATIDPNRATPSRELAGDIRITTESEHTTHLSVLDKDRMAVSLTYTLESSWGSRVVVHGGGFLLNDEMNDFNWLPGVTNLQGRIGTPANDVAPGKRMLSSMCPAIVRRDGKNVLVTGSPGGRTIINTVLCVVLNVTEFGMPLRNAVDAARMHDGWLPEAVRVEPALKEQHATAIERLKAMGHSFAKPAVQGDAHSISVDAVNGEITAAADGRISGAARGY